MDPISTSYPEKDLLMSELCKMPLDALSQVCITLVERYMHVGFERVLFGVLRARNKFSTQVFAHVGLKDINLQAARFPGLMTAKFLAYNLP